MPDPSQLAALEAAALRSKDPFARLVVADALAEVGEFRREFAWRWLGLMATEPNHGPLFWWFGAIGPADAWAIWLRNGLPSTVLADMGRSAFTTRKAALAAAVIALAMHQRDVPLPPWTSPRVWRAAK